MLIIGFIISRAKAILSGTKVTGFSDLSLRLLVLNIVSEFDSLFHSFPVHTLVLNIVSEFEAPCHIGGLMTK